MAQVRLSRKLAVEFLGTAALVVCGPGTAAATTMLGKSSGVAFSMAQLGVIALAFMMVIIAMIYTIGHISGCHINPAVTFALAAAKKTPWSEVPGYLVAQFAGGVAGAFAIWSILEQKGLDAGLGVLTYHPGHARAAFCAELIGTFLLVLVVFGTTTDPRATPGWYGMAIPSIVFAVITVVGPVTGAALNPARYLGPMIARAAIDGGKGLLWNQVPVYLTATFAAGLLAAAAYAFLGDVRAAPAHHHAKLDQKQRQKPDLNPDAKPQPQLDQRSVPKQRSKADRRPGTAPEWSTRQGITTVDAAAIRAWIHEAAGLMDDNAQYLTHLDAVIGDADHGINMRRGFQAALVMVDDPAARTPGAVLDIAGQAFMANLGGAAGPLYGSGFRKAAQAMGNETNVSAVQFGAALRAALAGIQELGAAVVGDKTMVDAWDPAAIAYQAVINTGGDLIEATRAAAQAAERGLHATAAMQARKGRASYVGARTIGHQDPGAASTVLILRALATTTATATAAAPEPIGVNTDPASLTWRRRP